MTKAKKTILSIIGFAIFLIIALLIQKTIISGKVENLIDWIKRGWTKWKNAH